MIKRAKQIRRIVTRWFKNNACESFQAFKDKEIEDILDMLQPKNFDTPEKAFTTCYKMWAKKVAYEDLEEQKQIADDYDLNRRRQND